MGALELRRKGFFVPSFASNRKTACRMRLPREHFARRRIEKQRDERMVAAGFRTWVSRPGTGGAADVHPYIPDL